MLVKPIGNRVWCYSGNSGTKLHVANNVRGPGFRPLCKSRGVNALSIIACGSDPKDEDRVCSRCAKYTVDAARATPQGET